MNESILYKLSQVIFQINYYKFEAETPRILTGVNYIERV